MNMPYIFVPMALGSGFVCGLTTFLGSSVKGTGGVAMVFCTLAIFEYIYKRMMDWKRDMSKLK